MKEIRLWQEFKGFAFKGQMIDLAVGVVLGAAFNGIIGSLVKNLIMPLLSYILPGDARYETWAIGRVPIGVFLSDLLNFLVIVTAVFLFVVKLFGAIQKVAIPVRSTEPTTKECALCLSNIPFKARKCPHCTADLE